MVTHPCACLGHEIDGVRAAAPGTRNVEAAINQIVEDATQCKFESTNNASDEIVLLNIVQVRPAPCVRAHDHIQQSV